MVRRSARPRRCCYRARWVPSVNGCATNRRMTLVLGAGFVLHGQKVRQIDQGDHDVVVGHEAGQEVGLMTIAGARHFLDLRRIDRHDVENANPPLSLDLRDLPERRVEARGRRVYSFGGPNRMRTTRPLSRVWRRRGPFA